MAAPLARTHTQTRGPLCRTLAYASSYLLTGLNEVSDTYIDWLNYSKRHGRPRSPIRCAYPVRTEMGNISVRSNFQLHTSIFPSHGFNFPSSLSGQFPNSFSSITILCRLNMPIRKKSLKFFSARQSFSATELTNAAGSDEIPDSSAFFKALSSEFRR